LALVDYPFVALIIAFGCLGLMIYRRVNLGITLNATAFLLAMLSLDFQTVPSIIYATTVDLLTISVVLATFGIMLLSQLYKETKLINSLSEAASRVINNSKIVSSLLPAVIGFLPVAGGALMSAPLVDCEADRLGLKPDKKAYVNVWFRHTIFPVYPISQVLIITAALTGIAVPFIIIRQIPVVVVMIVVGYLIAFWRVSTLKPQSNCSPGNRSNLNSDLKRFFVAFSPILATILAVVVLDAAGLGLASLGFDVFIATFLGVFVLIMIARPSSHVLVKPLKGWSIYGIALAAYGAFLLRNVTIATGISEMLQTLVANGSIDVILLLTLVPAILGFATGSPSGGVAIAVSILAGTLTFSAKTAALLYMSAYLGYLIVPSHLCLAFTVDYFKCSLGRIYRYMLPSFLISFAATVLVYFLL